MFENQIVGITRFSIPSLDAFEVSQSSIEDCEALLYAPERLDQRFALFEQFCLPSLVEQTDTDFLSLILIGLNLPQAYKDRLLALIDPHEHICVVEVAPDRHFKMINKVVRHLPPLSFTHRTTFRLDDDDMVDKEYVARLRAQSAILTQISPNEPVAVAYHLGYYLDISEDTPAIYEVRENLPLGLALSVTAPINWHSNIYAWNHRFVPKKCSTFTDLQTPSFVRTMHGWNDAPRQAKYDSTALKLKDVIPIAIGAFPSTLAPILNSETDGA